jgi:ribosomal protein S8E
MNEVSKTVSEMQQRIATKLRAVGANSRENAVTAREANFDDPEQNWLCYIAGGLFALIKKTPDKRYYVATYY